MFTVDDIIDAFPTNQKFHFIDCMEKKDYWPNYNTDNSAITNKIVDFMQLLEDGTIDMMGNGDELERED